MTRGKLSPSEIVERLQTIEALNAEGLSIVDALRLAGVRVAEHDRWRSEYAGLLRTLGPLPHAPQKGAKRARR